LGSILFKQILLFVDSQTHGSITTYLLAQISNGGSLTTLALHHKLLSI
jgi:hypothetical protein